VVHVCTRVNRVSRVPRDCRDRYPDHLAVGRSVSRTAGAAWGLVPLVVGLVALLWCVRDFYVSGKGTLAPWDPPRELVVVGLYRYTRNPMYVAVTLVLLGWSWALGSLGLPVYAVAVVIAFQLRVVLREEPWLAQTFGNQWRQ
jgi:protein-S-isoprenylcysteine O-methyltransferase Ste14